jgi:hypothetical protein
MRKALAIFFLLLFTFSTTEAYQLLKLPRLVSHFTSHKNDDGSLSLLEFLEEHYVGHHEEDGDSQADGQLPFKSFNTQAFSSFFLPVTTFASHANFAEMSPAFAGYIETRLTNNYFDIFHPPADV